MNGLFGGLFDFNLANLFGGGMNMGVNFDGLTMDQKRQQLRDMKSSYTDSESNTVENTTFPTPPE